MLWVGKRKLQSWWFSDDRKRESPSTSGVFHTLATTRWAGVGLGVTKTRKHQILVKTYDVRRDRESELDVSCLDPDHGGRDES